MSNTETKIISIDKAHRIRMLREIRDRQTLSVAYLCTKYGFETFAYSLLENEIAIDGIAEVTVVKR